MVACCASRDRAPADAEEGPRPRRLALIGLYRFAGDSGRRAQHDHGQGWLVQERDWIAVRQSAHCVEGAGGTSPAAIRTSDVAAALDSGSATTGASPRWWLENALRLDPGPRGRNRRRRGIAGQCLAARLLVVLTRLIAPGHPAVASTTTRRPCTPVRTHCSPAVLPDPVSVPPVADGSPGAFSGHQLRDRRRAGAKRSPRMGSLTRDRISPYFHQHP